MKTAVPSAQDATPWLAEGAEKRAAVQNIFAEIAPRYDLLNALMSMSRHRSWRREAVRRLQLPPGGTALDLCCGTGDFLWPLARAAGPKGRLLGLDFCLPMLEIARRKKAPGGLALGDASRIPVRSESSDAVTVGWGIRNVPDVDAAHREAFRVLKPGGRFVSVDMAVPENRFVRWSSQFVGGRLLPALGAVFGLRRAYTYLPQSTHRFLSREGLKRSMEAAGFREVGWRNFMLGNICVHWGLRP